MAYENRSRGPQSGDEKLFAPSQWPSLSAAADDYGYLLTRGYAAASTSELVGNRYRLNKRQRTALLRIGASDQAIQERQRKRLSADSCAGKTFAIDGFNLLILLEAVISGGFILLGRDGAYRDMASISGSYKRVAQTELAVKIVLDAFHELKVGQVNWYLDAPISNSGKLAGYLREQAAAFGANWTVELVADPDKTMNALTGIVALSGDSFVLDECSAWFDLPGYLFEQGAIEGRVLKL